MVEALDVRDNAPSVEEKLTSDIEFSNLLSQTLQLLEDEVERMVFELSYLQGLSPKEIQKMYPDTFPHFASVIRVKRKALKHIQEKLTLHTTELNL